MNEYLEQVKELIPDLNKEWPYRGVGSIDAFEKRRELTRKYSWAIPTDEALDLLVKYAPLVEIGAGTGYWAHLLEQRGVEIHAYDAYPPDGTHLPEGDYGEEKFGGRSFYHAGHNSYTHIRLGNQRKLKGYKARWNLFLCWPPMSNMAYQALLYHRGRYVVYIGESHWGCNADDAFFHRLDHKYNHVESVSIPQWDGLHDVLDVYERK